MKIPKVRVNEIFNSIQGEGALAGYSTEFIRFQGCRVGCKWCDSKPTWKHDTKDEWTSYDLVNHIVKTVDKKKWLCFTGGEPLEQAESLFWIIEKLSRIGYNKISIETAGITETYKNGEVKLPDKKKIYDVSLTKVFFSVSPKLPSALGNRFKLDSLRYITSFWYDSVENPFHLQFKFVVSSLEDIDALTKIYSVIDKKPDCHFFIQVEDSKIPDASFVKLCREFVEVNKEFRLTIQQHKVLLLR